MDICPNLAIWRWAFAPMAPSGDGYLFQWCHLAMDICPHGAIWRWTFAPMAPFGDGHLFQWCHSAAIVVPIRAVPVSVPVCQLCNLAMDICSNGTIWRWTFAPMVPFGDGHLLQWHYVAMHISSRSQFRSQMTTSHHMSWHHLAMDICSNGAIWRWTFAPMAPFGDGYLLQWRHLAMGIRPNGAIWRWAFAPMAPLGEGHLFQWCHLAMDICSNGAI